MPEMIIENSRFYYEVHGEGEPLILIHGLGSSTRDWELQVPAFAKYFKVITLDLRGHGRSAKPAGPYSMAMFAEDTAHLIKEIGAGPAHILGISLGGMVAFQLAIDHPDLIRSMIIVNSTPEIVPRTLREKNAIWQRLFIVRLMGMRKMGQVLGDRFFPRQDQVELKNIFIERWAENDQPAYLEAMKAVNGWSVTDKLGEITCPTLVIGADGDYFPTSDKENYTKLIPGAELVIIQDSMHAVTADKPGEFNEIVLEYLLGSRRM